MKPGTSSEEIRFFTFCNFKKLLTGCKTFLIFSLAGRTSENRLYLTSSNEWNCAQTEKAYLWFQQKLRGLITTGLSNETTMPPELRKVHLANDHAVLRAYGLKTDISEKTMVEYLFRKYSELTKHI